MFPGNRFGFIAADSIFDHISVVEVYVELNK
jgi:hypothetical protein